MRLLSHSYALGIAYGVHRVARSIYFHSFYYVFDAGDERVGIMLGKD